MSPLRDAGRPLAADDLGAGYAGFRQLLRLAAGHHQARHLPRLRHPPQRLAATLARALISFADDVGAAIIAEGVETAEELAALKDLGVPWVQGICGRPAPLAAEAPIKPHTEACD